MEAITLRRSKCWVVHFSTHASFPSHSSSAFHLGYRAGVAKDGILRHSYNCVELFDLKVL